MAERLALILAAIHVLAAMASRPAPEPAPTAMGAAGFEQGGRQPSVTPARTAAPSTSAATSPLPTATGTGPARVAAAPDPDTLRGTPFLAERLELHGRATWYPAGGLIAAAGPDLRAALGPGWRGSLVEVSAAGRAVVVRITDWCGCPRALLDLSSDAFARLAPVSRGVIRVTVRPIEIVPPATDAER